MNTQITWIDYIVENNPEGVDKILFQHGFEASDSMVEIYAKANDFIRERRDDAVYALMEAHPDFEFCGELYLKRLEKKKDFSLSDWIEGKPVTPKQEKTDNPTETFELLKLRDENHRMRQYKDIALGVLVGVLVIKALS